MARVPLTRERILEAAVRLADDGGIESLSMRRLARELGVEAMSLYNHFANKSALVDAAVDLVLEEIELPQSGDWDEALRQCAISAHEAFLRHPWACALVLSPSGSGGGLDTPRVRYMEWLLGRLREAGFSAGLTYSACHTLDSHILGSTLWQLGHVGAVRDTGETLADLAQSFVQQLGDDFPYLAEHAQQHATAGNDGSREFEFGLDLLLDGLRRARDGG